ncbi:MAG: thioredoxin domain-containing protein [Patescibacteria group bacterium]
MSMSKSLYIGVGAAAVAVVVAGLLIWQSQTKPFYPNINSPRPALGSDSAKVTVEEFSDFQCPACKAAETTVKEALNTFGDRIKFVYKHYPLVTIHTHAFPAAQAAECANDQEKFWLYHNTLFDQQPALSRSNLIKYAQDLSLDMTKFTACLLSGAKASVVRDDMREGDKRGVNSTPTFFINGEKVDDWTKLKELIQAKLIGG